MHDDVVKFVALINDVDPAIIHQDEKDEILEIIQDYYSPQKCAALS